MTLNLSVFRNAGLALVTAGVMPLLRLLLAIVLPLAPSSDFAPPANLHAQYDFIVGECPRVPGYFLGQGPQSHGVAMGLLNNV